MTNFEEMSRLSYIKQIALDIADVSTKKYFVAKQNDINSRFLEIVITEELKPKNIPDGTAVMLRGSKANGAAFLDEGIISNGKIYVDLSGAISVAGIAKCDINLTDTNGSISTVTFYVEVVPQPFNENAVIESEEFSALTVALVKVQEVINAYKNYIQIINSGDELSIFHSMKAGLYLLKAGSSINYVSSASWVKNQGLFPNNVDTVFKVYTDTEVIVSPWYGINTVPDIYVDCKRYIYISQGVYRYDETDAMAEKITSDNVYVYEWQGTTNNDRTEASYTATFTKYENKSETYATQKYVDDTIADAIGEALEGEY